jgi:MOSC domain-containing protein YiiM
MNPEGTMQPHIRSVNRSATYTLIKPSEPQITLLAGLGVEGDAHMGTTVKHRSRMAKDPTQPNLRQVHLIHHELHEELAQKGMPVLPGQMGENITTQGLDILALPKGTVLHLGAEAQIEVTGLRNPCHQLNNIQPGLLEAVLGRDADGNLIRKAGIMAIVLQGGVVHAGDAIKVVLPEGEPLPLQPV